ncbi:MAG: hypothetical protein J1E80_09520 [Desulfovibrionaceae bacterium]|nr:hypothetical protein [Desulfovibrionaceae bacterium]
MADTLSNKVSRNPGTTRKNDGIEYGMRQFGGSPSRKIPSSLNEFAVGVHFFSAYPKSYRNLLNALRKEADACTIVKA